MNDKRDRKLARLLDSNVIDKQCKNPTSRRLKVASLRDQCWSQYCSKSFFNSFMMEQDVFSASVRIVRM